LKKIYGEESLTKEIERIANDKINHENNIKKLILNELNGININGNFH